MYFNWLIAFTYNCTFKFFQIIKDSVAPQTFVNGLCTLQLHDLLPSDGGEYICKAKNSAGSETTSATVHVRGNSKVLYLKFLRVTWC